MNKCNNISVFHDWGYYIYIYIYTYIGMGNNELECGNTKNTN